MPESRTCGDGASTSASTGASIDASALAASLSSSSLPAAPLLHAPIAALPIATPMPLSVSLRLGLIRFPPTARTLVRPRSEIKRRPYQRPHDRKDSAMRFAGFALALVLGLA